MRTEVFGLLCQRAKLMIAHTISVRPRRRRKGASQMKLLFGLLACSFALAPVLAQDSHQAAATPSAILLPGMGNHHHRISTANPDAQKFFDQGLVLVYGFNREEAVRSFQRAAELNPSSPMPYWGMALARGFHLNMDLDMDVQANAAFAAIQKALALMSHAPQNERD